MQLCWREGGSPGGINSVCVCVSVILFLCFSSHHDHNCCLEIQQTLIRVIIVLGGHVEWLCEMCVQTCNKQCSVYNLITLYSWWAGVQFYVCLYVCMCVCLLCS